MKQFQFGEEGGGGMILCFQKTDLKTFCLKNLSPMELMLTM